MTKEQLSNLGNCLGVSIEAALPAGVRFALVVACNAEGSATDVHTSTASNLSGDGLLTVLQAILHAVEVDPDAIQLGRVVDTTPRGPAS